MENINGNSLEKNKSDESQLNLVIVLGWIVIMALVGMV